MAARGNAHKVLSPLGLDTCACIAPLIENAFIKLCRDKGISWVARYGPRVKGRYRKDTYKRGFKDCNTKTTLLSYDESDFLINKAHLKILPIQFKPQNYEKLNFSHGRKIGKIFADWAIRMGIPKKVHLWCDLEGVTTRAAKADRCMEYVSGWAYEVKKAGYNAGLYLYLKPKVGLKSRHLRQLVSGYYLTQKAASRTRVAGLQSILPLVTSFWNAPRNVKINPPYGYSIQQGFQVPYKWTCHNYVDKTKRKHKVREKCFYKRNEVDMTIVTKVKSKKNPNKTIPLIFKYRFSYDPDKLSKSKSKHDFPYMWGA